MTKGDPAQEEQPENPGEAEKKQNHATGTITNTSQGPQNKILKLDLLLSHEALNQCLLNTSVFNYVELLCS